MPVNKTDQALLFGLEINDRIWLMGTWLNGLSSCAGWLYANSLGAFSVLCYVSY